MLLSKYSRFRVQKSRQFRPLFWETRSWSAFTYPEEANHDPDSLALLPFLTEGPPYVETDDGVYFRKKPHSDLVNIWHKDRKLPGPFRPRRILTRNIEYERMKMKPEFCVISNDSPV